jgi:hypothetical protein
MGSAVLLAVYFPGLRTSQLPSFQGTLVEYLIAYLKFVLIYIGAPVGALIGFIRNPFGEDPSRMGGPGPEITLPIVAGAILVFLFAVLVLRAVFLKRLSAPRLTLIALGGFVLVSALSTASGRLGLGLQGAAGGRYGMGAILLTAATLLLAADYALERWRNVWALCPCDPRPPMAAFATVTMIAVATFQVHVARRERPWANLRKLPAAALLSDVNDQSAFSLIYPWKEQFPGLLAGVKSAHLGVFSEPWADWLGQKMPLSVKRGACMGNVEGFDPVTDGDTGARRAHGWASYPGHRLKTEQLVIVDSNDIVVGYGFSGWDRVDVRTAIPAIRSIYTGWYGYVRPGSTEPLTVYLLVEGNTLACPLGV